MPRRSAKKNKTKKPRKKQNPNRTPRLQTLSTRRGRFVRREDYQNTRGNGGKHILLHNNFLITRVDGFRQINTSKCRSTEFISIFFPSHRYGNPWTKIEREMRCHLCFLFVSKCNVCCLGDICFRHEHSEPDASSELGTEGKNTHTHPHTHRGDYRLAAIVNAS